MATHLERAAPPGTQIDATEILDFRFLPESAVLRLKDVLRLYPVSRSYWLEGVRKGTFPKPVKLGGKSIGWRYGEILKLLASVEPQERPNPFYGNKKKSEPK